MTQAAVAAEIHQTLDALLHLAPRVAFDLVSGLDRFGMPLISASVSSSTLRDSGMFAVLQIAFAVARPMP